MSKGISKEEFDRIKPRCQCICNGLLPWRKKYKYRPYPKYLLGHGKRGIPRNEETKEKISKSNTGKKRSKYVIENISYRMKGIKHSEKRKKKQSENSKGDKNPFYRKHHTKETKNKMSILKLGKSSPMKGKHHTEETKQKISKGNKRKKHTIEYKLNLSIRMKGKNHPMWNGGSSFEPYCEKFNKPLKEAVRERDSRLCQLCNKTELENGQKQTVHHVHYDKENCYPDLICLCASCNFKVNFNRDFWEELFTFMLWIRGMLYWKPNNQQL